MAFGVHTVNRDLIADENPGLLRKGFSVSTSDDASYLRPAINFVEGNGWKSSDSGVEAYVTRSPGYGLIYALLYRFSDERQSLQFLFFIQLLLWSAAVACIPFLARSVGISSILSFALAFVVSILPTFSPFLSYSITEGVTPALTILFFGAIINSREGGNKNLLIAGLVGGLILLIRPPLIVLLFSFLPKLIKSEERRISIAALAIMLFPLGLWQTKVYHHTGRIDLHPIYHEDSNSLYRPIHREIWEFHKMTGQEGVEFHKSIELINQVARDSSLGKVNISGVLEFLPNSVFESIDKERLSSAYYDYAYILRTQFESGIEGDHMLGNTTKELKLMERFQAFRSEYVADHFLHAWLISPLKNAKDLIFHSNLSLRLFQKYWRGNIFIETIRYLSFFIHVFAYCGLLLLVFRPSDSRKVIFILLPFLIYFGYLIFIQRGLEERYLLPFLVPIFILSFSGLNNLIKK